MGLVVFQLGTAENGYYCLDIQEHRLGGMFFDVQIGVNLKLSNLRYISYILTTCMLRGKDFVSLG